jgi:hypothetical protein
VVVSLCHRVAACHRCPVTVETRIRIKFVRSSEGVRASRKMLSVFRVIAFSNMLDKMMNMSQCILKLHVGIMQE